MTERFWYTILYYLVLTEAISLFICIDWVVKKDQVSKNCDEDISYLYYVVESKRLLQELM